MIYIKIAVGTLKNEISITNGSVTLLQWHNKLVVNNFFHRLLRN